jgi:hypothetical protein
MRAAIMARKATKSRQKPPKRRQLYTPEPVRERVIARRMSGESNRQIAREEGIDRETVGRILSQPEVEQMKAQYQSRLLSLGAKAIGVYDEALSSGDLRIATPVATRVLEGVGVLQKGGIDQNAWKPDPEQQKSVVLGQLTDVMYRKMKAFGISVPPKLDRIEAEAALLATPAVSGEGAM